MKNLWTFGCSFTEGFVNDRSDSFEKYKEYCGGSFPESWPSILGKKLNLQVKNLGEGASGNQQIFQQICNNCKYFSQNDIIIIGWTFLERYRVAIDNHTWLKLGPGKINHKESFLLSEDCHQSIIVNRTLKPYKDEIYSYENIIDRLCEALSINVYYWTMINELIYDQPKKVFKNKKYLLSDSINGGWDNVFKVVKDHGGMTITEETNGMIEDSHMGKSGHKVQADLFYDHIINYNRKWTSL